MGKHFQRRLRKHKHVKCSCFEKESSSLENIMESSSMENRKRKRRKRQEVVVIVNCNNRR